MIRRTHVFAALLAIGVPGALISAQAPLPGAPPVTFGSGVTPAFEGWYDNPDGTHTFLIGYYNRNTRTEVDVPLGPANHFEPGTPDMGQPTHFLTGRRYGMFTYTVPKEFGKNQKLTWSITVNGITAAVPFYMGADYNVSPLRSSEQGPTGGYNLPPVLRFAANGPSFAGPIASAAKAISLTAVAGVPMPLDFYVDDDGLFTSGTNAPMLGNRPPVTLVVSKYRGPGDVKIDPAPRLEAERGGKPGEAFAGKGSTQATFSDPGEYMLHVTANDYSGNGGGGAVCCWTTAIAKVSVKGGAAPHTTGQ